MSATRRLRLSKHGRRWRVGNGVFGFKAHYRHVRDVIDNVELLTVYPNLQLIYIDRSDAVLQGISHHL